MFSADDFESKLFSPKVVGEFQLKKQCSVNSLVFSRQLANGSWESGAPLRRESVLHKIAIPLPSLDIQRLTLVSNTSHINMEDPLTTCLQCCKHRSSQTKARQIQSVINHTKPSSYQTHQQRNCKFSNHLFVFASTDSNDSGTFKAAYFQPF